MDESKLLPVIRRPSSKGNPYMPSLAEIAKITPQTKHEKLYKLVFRDRGLRDRFTFDSGQFIMLSLFGAGEAPFSISSSPTQKGYIEVCVREAGRVTKALHQKKVNDVVGIRGPLGRGFPFEGMKGHDVLLIAGGIGLVPLRSLILNVLDNRCDFGEVHILYGLKNPAEALFTRELSSWKKRKDVLFETIVDVPDKRWKGHVGVVTKLLEKKKIDPDNTYVAICGPPVMYRFVVDLLEKRDVPTGRIMVSLERRMHCGIGKCARCGIGYKFTCLDGPVFNYWEVMNLQEAI